MQPMADLASRFDRQDTPVALGRNCKLFDERRILAWRYFCKGFCLFFLDGFPQTDAITLQHVATEAFLGRTKHSDEAVVVIDESPAQFQQACKWLKTAIANNKPLVGKRCPFKI